MKNLLKFLAAMMIIALPFAVASCGSDDEPEPTGPYTFTWAYEDYIDPSAPDLTVYQQAIQAIDQAFTSQLNQLGYKATASSKSFTRERGKSDEDMKSEIGAAITLTKVNAGESCKKLKSGAKIVVKRDDKVFYSAGIN